MNLIKILSEKIICLLLCKRLNTVTGREDKGIFGIKSIIHDKLQWWVTAQLRLKTLSITPLINMYLPCLPPPPPPQHWTKCKIYKDNLFFPCLHYLPIISVRVEGSSPQVLKLKPESRKFRLFISPRVTIYQG